MSSHTSVVERDETERTSKIIIQTKSENPKIFKIVINSMNVVLGEHADGINPFPAFKLD